MKCPRVMAVSDKIVLKRGLIYEQRTYNTLAYKNDRLCFKYF